MRELKTFACLLSISAIVGCAGSKMISIIDKPEVMAWGNLTGIRVDGQLMEFKTCLRVVQSDWSDFDETTKERRSQRHRYSRNGNTLTLSALLDSLSFTQVIEETGPGVATIAVQCSVRADTNIAGAFFCIELPGADYAGGKAQLINPAPSTQAEISLAATLSEKRNEYLHTTAGGVRFIVSHRQLEVMFATPTEIIIRNEVAASENHNQRDSTNVHVYLALISGNAKKGLIAQNIFTLKATGKVDRNPVELVVNPSRPGRVFDGLGGNFRLQNPKTDPPVIQYNLENLRVAWGRVEMPWHFWHPDEDVDPIEAAETGKLHERVRAAMEMAHTLVQRGMPVIVSDWSAPAWAIIGDPRDAFRPQPGGLRGYPLNPEKMEKIYQSMGAVSFHSWRGCTDEILTQWSDAARELNVPLLVGEGSTDAAAWTYPQIFGEPSFALHEINLYTRLCAISQPKAILQWQLTADYSLLVGGGVFGNEKEPLRPTQRFWNLKQLASTSAGAFALPIMCDRLNITSAAFGDLAKGQYAVHILKFAMLKS
jgi:hypothetical protein